MAHSSYSFFPQIWPLLFALSSALTACNASPLMAPNVRYAGQHRPENTAADAILRTAEPGPGEEILGSIAASCETSPLPQNNPESPQQCSETTMVRAVGAKAAEIGGARLIGLECRAWAQGSELSIEDRRKNLIDALLSLGFTLVGSSFKPQPTGPGELQRDPTTGIVVPREQVVCTADVSGPAAARR